MRGITWAYGGRPSLEPRALESSGRDTHLGCELTLGILGSTQVLDKLFIFHCALNMVKISHLCKTLRSPTFPSCYLSVRSSALSAENCASCCGRALPFI